MRSKKAMVRATLTFGSIAVLCGSLSACINLGLPHGMGPGGLLVSSYTIGVSGHKLPAANQPNLKTSEGCTYQVYPILLVGAFAWGHASITDVAKKNNINTIYTVNKKIFNFLYLFSYMCTVVTGVEGGHPSATKAEGGSVKGFTDTVVLKNGKEYSGVKAAVAGDRIVITTTDGKTIVHQKSEVKAIQRGK